MSADRPPSRNGRDLALLPWLVPAASRPHLVCLLHFAEAARSRVRDRHDDAGERLARLRALNPERQQAAGDADPDDDDRAFEISRALARSIAATGVPVQHVRHFLQACERETSGWSAATWSDLLVHARFAAASIGRHALAVLGEHAAGVKTATDALCTAAWILEELRGIAVDAASGRPPRCIPARFLADAMITTDHLQAPAARGQIRAVLDRVLDGVDHLLAEAAPLPDVVTARGTSRHARILLCRANALSRRLRSEDPLAATVRLRRWQRRRCLVLGVLPRLRRGR